MPALGATEIASRRTGRLRQTCFVVGVPICRRSGGNPQLSTWTSLARRPSGVNNPGGFHRLEVSLLVIDSRGDDPCRTDRAALIRFDSLNHKRDQEAPPMGVFHARSIFGASDKSKRPPDEFSGLHQGRFGALHLLWFARRRYLLRWFSPMQPSASRLAQAVCPTSCIFRIRELPAVEQTSGGSRWRN